MGSYVLSDEPVERRLVVGLVPVSAPLCEVAVLAVNLEHGRAYGAPVGDHLASAALVAGCWIVIAHTGSVPNNPRSNAT